MANVTIHTPLGTRTLVYAVIGFGGHWMQIDDEMPEGLAVFDSHITEAGTYTASVVYETGSFKSPQTGTPLNVSFEPTAEEEYEETLVFKHDSTTHDSTGGVLQGEGVKVEPVIVPEFLKLRPAMINTISHPKLVRILNSSTTDTLTINELDTEGNFFMYVDHELVKNISPAKVLEKRYEGVYFWDGDNLVTSGSVRVAEGIKDGQLLVKMPSFEFLRDDSDEPVLIHGAPARLRNGSIPFYNQKIHSEVSDYDVVYYNGVYGGWRKVTGASKPVAIQKQGIIYPNETVVPVDCYYDVILKMYSDKLHKNVGKLIIDSTGTHSVDNEINLLGYTWITTHITVEDYDVTAERKLIGQYQNKEVLRD